MFIFILSSAGNFINITKVRNYFLKFNSVRVIFYSSPHYKIETEMAVMVVNFKRIFDIVLGHFMLPE